MHDTPTDRSRPRRDHIEPAANPEDVVHHPERVPGYSYGTSSATPSPLTLDDLMELKAAVGLAGADDAALRAQVRCWLREPRR